MATLTITIDTGNAAFSEGESIEVARILRQYADKIDGEYVKECVLMDVNGNHVGEVTFA